MKDEKMKESFEKIKPSDETRQRMLRNVINTAQTDKNSNLWHSVGKEFFMKKVVIAAVVAVCILAVSGSAYAAYSWLNAKEAVSEIGYEKLSKYFDIDKDVIQVEENDTYRAAFLGIVSGSNINDQILEEDIDKKLTYIVTVVKRKDGKDMTADDEIVVSPFIRGIRPMDFSIYSIHGGVAMMRKDGVLYVLTECDDLEIFADREVYLAVMDGANMGEGYNYDEKTGLIERSKDFDGLNLLFELDLDKSKADPEKARKYIDEMVNGTSSEPKIKEESEAGEEAERMAEYADNGLDESGVRVLDPEAFLKKCQYIEGSEKKLKPDKEGNLRYSYEEDGFSLCHSAEYVKEKEIIVERPSRDSDNTEEEVVVWEYKNGEYIGKAYLYVNEDFQGHNDLKNPEEVIKQAKLVKDSEKELTPDKNGIIKYVSQDIDLGTTAECVKKNGMDTSLFYGEGKSDDEILVFTYENGEYIGRLYTCSQSITRKAENK